MKHSPPHPAPPAPARSGAAVSASDLVYENLRERILNFALPPGATLARKDVAELYDVSQTPVREALQRLEQDGLVLIYPQSRTVVARIDVRQLFETQFLRVAVETEVVRRCTRKPDAEAMNRAAALLKMQRALVNDMGQPDLFTELDRDFHRTFFQAIGMDEIRNMLARRLGHLARCQRLELPQKGRAKNIVHAHQAILDGIASGDPERAASAMRVHLSGTISRVAAIRADYPDYFTADALPERDLLAMP